jgi:hypothetical protein
MDLISGYNSDEEVEEALPQSMSIPSNIIDTAPTSLTVHNANKISKLSAAIDMKTNMLVVNSRVDVVLAPINGPANPFKLNAGAAGTQRSGVGSVEATNIEDWCFNEQYQTYQKSGYAVDGCIKWSRISS